MCGVALEREHLFVEVFWVFGDKLSPDDVFLLQDRISGLGFVQFCCLMKV